MIMGGPTRPQILIRQSRLTVTSGPDLGVEHTFDGSRFIFGTDESCVFRLTDPAVSRVHCSLGLHRDAVRIRDLESSNGTFVNGVKVIEAELQSGDRIQIGNTVISFQVGDTTKSLDLSTGQSFGPLLGRSTPMRQVFALLEQVAASDATVLIQGETGTGKDLVATAIHEASPRSRSPFVVLDCAAIPAHLMEDELMGHERGAFTGAATVRRGAFEMAHRGTLFLDEVGELPLDLQPKLLRVLESHTYRRIGSNEPRHVDVRVVAATNRDLAAEVGRGHFRQDLFYRLNVIQVDLPALRDRPDDIGFLAQTFLRRLLGRLPDDSLSDYLSPQAMEQIRSHAWPGNVRELLNHVQRMVTLSQPDLRPMNANLGGARPETGRPEGGPQGAGLPSTSGRGKVPTLSGSAPAPTLGAGVASTPRGTSRPQVGAGPGVGSTPESHAATDDQVPADLLEQPFKPAKEEWTSRFERRYLAHLVEKTHGNISAAARMAQVDRAYLYKLLRRYDLLDTNE